MRDRQRKLRQLTLSLVQRSGQVLFICLAFLAYSHCQEPVPQTKNPVLVGKRFVEEMYPDLKGKGYMTVEFTQRFDSAVEMPGFFRLSIGEGPKDSLIGYVGGCTPGVAPQDCHPGPIHPKQYLLANFEFENERIISFSASGNRLGDPEAMEKVGKILSNHPKMTDLQAKGTLIELGAKFGSWDKELFVEHLPKKQFERFLGTLSITTVTCPAPDQSGVLPSSWPMLTVTAETTDSGRPKLTYKMEFEPFKGDLRALTTVPYPPTTRN